MFWRANRVLLFSAFAVFSISGCVTYTTGQQGVDFHATNLSGWARPDVPRVEGFESGEVVILTVQAPESWDGSVVTVLVRNAASGDIVNRQTGIPRFGEVMGLFVRDLKAGNYLAALSRQGTEVSHFTFSVGR